MNSSDSLELSKADTKMAQGVAILGMVMLHLFCRLGPLPYTPLVWLGDTPLIYYLGLFGDCCVPIYCFCSGYAHYLLFSKHGKDYKKRIPHKTLSFLTNYWIVVILFALIGFLNGKSPTVPGSWQDFIGNMLLVGMNYNGAWWFVITYLILLGVSPLMAFVVQRDNPFIIIFLSGCFYVIAYLLRFSYSITIDNKIIQWFYTQSILLGTSQITYIIGMLSYKYKLITKIRLISEHITSVFTLNTLLVLFIVCLIIIHALIPSLFIAPITALGVLFCLFISKLSQSFRRILQFLGLHSTNIWLVHMFFYLKLFEGLSYVAKYPLFILSFCLCISVGISYIIIFSQSQLIRYIKNKK